MRPRLPFITLLKIQLKKDLSSFEGSERVNSFVADKDVKNMYGTMVESFNHDMKQEDFLKAFTLFVLKDESLVAKIKKLLLKFEKIEQKKQPKKKVVNVLEYFHEKNVRSEKLRMVGLFMKGFSFGSDPFSLMLKSMLQNVLNSLADNIKFRSKVKELIENK
ncbi:hypothetical protein KY328_00190 [Candidatus Woesearchaeota archaeon]|nr:hypothetical protein [Candidatus Woesearchaeota archaeon]MBW3021317.1 hypothetical protein [Candidatus Woesearchaeota archaeon]